jgi:hypothetical protein
MNKEPIEEEMFMPTPPECRVCGYNHEPDCDTKHSQEPMEAHETENGWCCACDYDLIELENRIKQAEEREREIIVNEIETMELSGKSEDYEQALDDIINVINQNNE